MNLDSHPLIIDFNSGQIFGILRGSKEAKKIMILCPAVTGTRIGPQRIYVEIAQKLEKINVASYCTDIPPLGDSFDNIMENSEGVYSERLIKHYTKYLQIIIKYFEEKFHFNEFILLSISDGCLPLYNYVKENAKFQKVILLSPTHQLGASQTVNTKNLRQYYIKLFKKETWIKLVSLKLNFRKIVKNIFKKVNRKKTTMNSVKETREQRIIKDVLVLFGEKETKLNECLKYWDKEKHDNINKFTLNIIKGADHSFFGWQFKWDVEKSIIDWLSNQSN